MLEQRDVLVTGGSGFIGGHLVAAFREANDVTIFDRTLPADGDVPGDVAIVEGDVRDGDAVDAAVADADVVFHEAALVSVDASVSDPIRSHGINARGTLNVLEAARRHDARVVVASSAAVYGHPERTPIRETDRLEPTSPYGLEKLAADHYARLYHDLYGLETVPLRYFNAYGPGQSGGDYAGVIEVFLEQAREGGPITVHGDGEQTRDFVHVEDIVQANRLAAEADAVGEAFNVGTGTSITIRELAGLVRELVGSDAEIVHTEPRPGDIRHSCADVSRARERLGYSPARAVEEGLADVVTGGG